MTVILWHLVNEMLTVCSDKKTEWHSPAFIYACMTTKYQLNHFVFRLSVAECTREGECEFEWVDNSFSLFCNRSQMPKIIWIINIRLVCVTFNNTQTHQQYTAHEVSIIFGRELKRNLLIFAGAILGFALVLSLCAYIVYRVRRGKPEPVSTGLGKYAKYVYSVSVTVNYNARTFKYCGIILLTKS